MNQKLIKKKDRIILIKNELTEPKYWEELLESLTFEEGMAMMSAMIKYSKKYNFDGNS